MLYLNETPAYQITEFLEFTDIEKKEQKMNKKLTLSTIIFCLLVSSQSIFAESKYYCDGTHIHPCIVQDTENNTPKLKYWRDNFDLAKSTEIAHGNAKGLHTLWMSGSAEASVAGFNTIVNNIKTATNNRVMHMVDVDLRKESHGFLNKNAITLGTKNDWINLDKTRDQALSAEQNWLDQIAKMKSVYVVGHDTFKKKLYDDGHWVFVHAVSDEETVAKNHQMDYLRIMVNDHMRPDDDAVDRFVNFVDNEKPNTWMYFHCRGGLGRTTTFMVMYDMLHNANKASLEEIVAREASYAPHYNVLKVLNKQDRYTQYFQRRAMFVKQFYKFAQAHLQDNTLSWSVWFKANENTSK